MAILKKLDDFYSENSLILKILIQTIGIKKNFTTLMPRQIKFTIIAANRDVIRIVGLKISWFATH
jgi:hypothetical protein